MPIICYVPIDPTDLLLMGESLRQEAIEDGIHAAPAPFALMPLLCGGMEPYLWDAPELIPGVQNFLPMIADDEPMQARKDLLRSQTRGTLITNNACICTPCGAIYPIKLGQQTPEAQFTESATRFFMVGVTKDSTGTPVGNCTVVVMDISRFEKGLPDAVIDNVQSDGSGNFSVEVPRSGGLMVLAYKPGSPDIAGVTDFSIEVNTIA